MLKKTAVLRILISLALTLLMSGVLLAQGKPKQGPVEKSVTGVVTDADGNAIPGAVVQLKNMKTLQVRSFIAKDKGDYIFQGLSPDADYQLVARWNGKESPSKTVSTFDSHPEVVINFQVK